MTTTTKTHQLETLLVEQRRFPPPSDFAANTAAMGEPSLPRPMTDRRRSLIGSARIQAVLRGASE